MSKDPVEHFVDGRTAWMLGAVGFFNRIRGLVTIVIVTVLTSGAPWWWPSLRTPALVDLRVAIPAVGIAVYLAFLYLRRRSIRSLQVKYTLHRITHQLRDHLVICSEAATAGVRGPLRQRRELETEMKDICESIREYFRLLLNDESIAAAIRVMRRTGTIVSYRTIARSTGLNPDRAAHTQDLRADEGLARYFETKGNRGVLVYHDLAAAARLEMFKPGENERLFPNEIISMMVAPITVAVGADKHLIGLLYVTSSRGGVFGPKYTDSLLFVADAVATSLWGIFRAYFPRGGTRRGS